MPGQVGAQLVSNALASLRAVRLPANFAAALASARTTVVLCGPRMRAALSSARALRWSRMNNVLLAFSLTPLLGKNQSRTESAQNTDEEEAAAASMEDVLLALFWAALPFLLPLVVALVMRVYMGLLTRRREAAASTPPSPRRPPLLNATAAAAIAAASPATTPPRTPPLRKAKTAAATTPTTAARGGLPGWRRHTVVRTHRDELYSQAAAAVAELRKAPPTPTAAYQPAYRAPEAFVVVAEEPTKGAEGVRTTCGVQAAGAAPPAVGTPEAPTAETAAAESEDPVEGCHADAVDACAGAAPPRVDEPPEAAADSGEAAMTPCASKDSLEVSEALASEALASTSTLDGGGEGRPHERSMSKRPPSGPRTSSEISSNSSSVNSPTIEPMPPNTDRGSSSLAAPTPRRPSCASPTSLTRQVSSSSSADDACSVVASEAGSSVSAAQGRRLSARRALSMSSSVGSLSEYDDTRSPSERAQAMHERALRREQLIRTSMQNSTRLRRARGSSTGSSTGSRD